LKIKLSELSRLVNGNIIGDDVFIQNIAAPQNCLRSSIVLVKNKKNLKNYQPNKAGAILTSAELSEFFINENLLVTKNPDVAFSKITNIFNTSKLMEASIGSVILGDNVNLGKNVKFGFNVVIESNVSIGDNTQIGHNVVVHSNTTIGNDVIIDSGTIIGSEGFGNTLDEDFNWQHIKHLGGVIIKDKVMIGSNCTIDRGTLSDTIIENGVVMDNQIHLAHNVLIGENSAIAAKVGIAGSCNIGKRNMIGGMVGIVDHINTTDDVIISATSTVNKDIIEPGVYTGIMPISKHVTWKRIALWITKLDKIAKFLKIKKI